MMRSTGGFYAKLLVAALALPVMAAPALAAGSKNRESKAQARQMRSAEPASTGTLRRGAVVAPVRSAACVNILCPRYTLIGVGF